MASLKSLLDKSKTSPQKPTNIVIKKKDELYGSGITKRKAVQAEKDIEKLQQEAYTFVEEHKDELGEVVNLNIPSNLMDDSIKLDEDQIAAVQGLKKQKYGCLIGQAGVGKTTTVKAIVKELVADLPVIDLNCARIITQKNNEVEKDLNVAMCFGTFMGKGVQQIKRALPKEYHNLCDTIHGLLGYAPVYEERTDPKTGEVKNVKVFKPSFTELNKLPYKICIIDEAGTVPVYLWNELLAALPEDCRIFLMGDLNQIPPVSGHSVLGYAITQWPTYTLTKIHRQAKDNPIISNADRIIHGKKPLSKDNKFIVKDVPDSGFQAFQHTCAVIQSLHKKGLFDPLRDAFIVPQNIDTLGQIAFNEKLVRYFNPTKKINGIAVNPPIVITAGWQHVTYAVGDKVMILNNDRQAGLTNGMVGVVEEIKPNPKFNGDAIADQVVSSLSSDNDMQLDLSNLHEAIKEQESKEDEVGESERQASHLMIVKFQNVDEPVEFASAGSFRKVAHSYAMTCHKSQGSEYPTVIILCHSSNLNMLSREWLYTAVTRAKERVILLVNHRGITHAVNRQLIKGTTIQEKAKKFIKLTKAGDDRTLPILPEPEDFVHEKSKS